MSTLIQRSDGYIVFRDLTLDPGSYVLENVIISTSGELPLFGGAVGTEIEIVFTVKNENDLDLFFNGSHYVGFGTGQAPDNLQFRGVTMPDLTSVNMDGGAPQMRVKGQDLLGLLKTEPRPYNGYDTILNQVRLALIDLGADDLYTSSETLFTIDSSLFHDGADTDYPFFTRAALPFGMQASKLLTYDNKEGNTTLELAGTGAVIADLRPAFSHKSNEGRVELLYKGSPRETLDNILRLCGMGMVQSRGRYYVRDLNTESAATSVDLTRGGSWYVNAPFNQYLRNVTLRTPITRMRTDILKSFGIGVSKYIAPKDYTLSTVDLPYQPAQIKSYLVEFEGYDILPLPLNPTNYTYFLEVTIRRQNGDYLNKISGWSSSYQLFDTIAGTVQINNVTRFIRDQVTLDLLANFVDNDFTITLELKDVRIVGTSPGGGTDDDTKGIITPQYNSSTLQRTYVQRYNNTFGTDQETNATFDTYGEKLDLDPGQQLLSAGNFFAPSGAATIWAVLFSGKSLAEKTSERLGDALNAGKDVREISHEGYVTPSSRISLNGKLYRAVSISFDLLQNETSVNWREI